MKDLGVGLKDTFGKDGGSSKYANAMKNKMPSSALPGWEVDTLDTRLGNGQYK